MVSTVYLLAAGATISAAFLVVLVCGVLVFPTVRMSLLKLDRRVGSRVHRSFNPIRQRMERWENSSIAWFEKRAFRRSRLQLEIAGIWTQLRSDSYIRLA